MKSRTMMLKSHNAFKILILLCLIPASTLINGCSADKLPRDLNFEGLLVYEQQSAFFVHGYFPDLVALDPEDGRQYKLTRRGPYNVHPSFVSGARYIFFESIRQRDHGGISQIYVLDTRNGRYRTFHKGMDLRRVHGYWDQHSIPAVNNAENRVYFYSYSCKCIVSEKITGGDRFETPIKFQYAPFKMIWSDDYQYLLVQKSVLKKGGRPIDSYWQIHVYNANTWEVANVLARDGWNITIGDMYEGNLFHTSREVKAGATTEIVSYNIYTGEQKILLTTDELTELDGLYSPVFMDSSIFFIGVSGQRNDIYRFDSQNRDLERLTNNNRMKRNLRIHRNFEPLNE